jgi:hypothetical protein
VHAVDRGVAPHKGRWPATQASGVSASRLAKVDSGRDGWRAVPRWIHAGVIPGCPCGAPSQDQVRRTSGGATVCWHCLVCELRRPAQEGWADPLMAVSDAEWVARNRRRQAWARQRVEREEQASRRR